MMDEFEKNIRQHNEAFGGHKPNRDKMWANIESRLPASEAKRIPLWKNNKLRFAAGFLLLFGMAAILFNTMDNSSSNELADNFPVELLEINMHYKKLVDFQITQLQASNKLSKVEKKEFIAYILELDKENNQLKTELQNNLDNQEVLEAIVGNYKQQIEIIERILDRLNNSQKKNEDEGITI